MGRSIISQEVIVERLLLTLLCNGNVLVEGLPGLAKTRAVKSLAENLKADFSRIQFTPDPDYLRSSHFSRRLPNHRKVQIEQDPEVDLGKYTSFSILPVPDRMPGADPGVVLRAGRTVKSAVLADLTGMGYSEVALDSADFAVNLTGKVGNKAEG